MLGPGTTWYSGHGTPGSNPVVIENSTNLSLITLNSNDHYINVDTGIYYVYTGPSWNNWSQVATNLMGPEGFQGPQGPIGFQGFQGIQGAQGFQGNQGIQGAQGFQGSRGFQGFQGFQGNTGADSTVQIGRAHV